MLVAGVALALGLGLDVFAAGLAFGLAGVPRRHWMGVALVFAVLGGLMVLLGVLAGRWLGDTLGAPFTYLAGGLLIVIGARALGEAWPGGRDAAGAAGAAGSGAPAGEGSPARPPGTAAVVLTGGVLTLDELVVGLALGAAGLRVGPLLAAITVQNFLFTVLGLALGERLGGRLGAAADLLAGVVFVVLGLAVLIGALRG